MGLFKHKTQHEKKLKKAYKCIPAMVRPLFPNIQVANNIILSYRNVLRLNLDSLSIEDYIQLFKNYAFSRVCLIVNSHNDYPPIFLKENSRFFPDEESIIRFHVFTIFNASDGFTVVDSASKAFFEKCVDGYKKNLECSEKNSLIVDLYINDSDFGLIPGKPLFVAGYEARDTLVKQIKTDSGVSLTVKRNGTTTVPEVNGIIDIYDCFLPNGVNYKTIYVCSYSNKNSSGLPQGFSK